ncbi:MAG: PAS domain S-box protein [Desulfobacteraceae bacterium]|nr:PAS domain S-box protein [Desulfobacteraceae bacterium]
MIKPDRATQSEQQTQFLVRKNAEILEMIATGQPTYSIYDEIALMYETRHPGMRCSLLELKGDTLKHGGAPSLPKEYCDAVNGLKIGPSVGSCGTSTYTGKRVLVENIETDSRWSEIKQVALPHGMRCCWSEPIKDSNGKVMGAFGMYYNHPALPNEDESNDLYSAARLAGIVMERDQREKALRQSEKKFRSLFENSNDGIILHDLAGNILETNTNAIKILGYDKDELNQWSVKRIHPESEKKISRQALEQTKNKGKFKFETKFIKKDGSIIDVAISSSIIDYSKSVVQGIFRDITKQKKYENELKKNQERYKSLSKMLRMMCDNVPDMIWAKDLDKRFIFVNKTICQNLLNAIDSKEPIGKTDLFFAERERADHPNDPTWHTFGELCQDSDSVTMEKGVTQQFDEFGNIKGKFLFLDVYKSPFLDETGKMIGTVGSARDVTRTKEIEKELNTLNEELEEIIKKRTSSLEDVNTALRVLLKGREEDKKQISENIYANFSSLILPLLKQLRNSLTIKTQEEILDILESAIKEMASPFSKKLADPIMALTPTEILVAGLVKDGKTNKEISQILNKSIRAVSSHRDKIRHKFGLKNKKINLRTYLLSLN